MALYAPIGQINSENIEIIKTCKPTTEQLSLLH